MPETEWFDEESELQARLWNQFISNKDRMDGAMAPSVVDSSMLFSQVKSSQGFETTRKSETS